MDLTKSPGSVSMHRHSKIGRGSLVLAILLAAIAAARVVSTYHEFGETDDEGRHLACGMQLIQDRRYSIDVHHPPLARIAMALPLYLEGQRLSGSLGDGTEPGNAILYGNNRFWNNLTLARAGTLLFLFLACFVVWSWSRHISGALAALFAVLALTQLPPVLAHSGVATNDVAGAATVTLALYCLTLWIENPTWKATAWLGVGTGLALASKFSALLFLPACAAAVGALFFVAGDGFHRKYEFLKLTSKIAACLAIAYLVICAGYLFTVAPLESGPQHPIVDRLFGGHPIVDRALSTILEVPYPAGKLAGGLAGLALQNRAGQVSFFLGEWRRHGWWYFFPVMFLVKTPLPFLALSAIAGAVLARSFWRKRDWRPLAPLLFALVVLLTSMTSGINIGLRHVLAMYPLLCIAVGYAASRLWDAVRWRLVFRATVAGLFVWLISVSALAHPDYLAYFNVFGSDRPERIEVDSDLDWGQDLARLSRWLRQRGVQEVAISYFGAADLTRSDLPRFHELQPYEKVGGWIAISARNRMIPRPFRVIPAPPGVAVSYTIPGNFKSVLPGTGPFAWLGAYKPLERIGKSIFVYNIPLP